MISTALYCALLTINCMLAVPESTVAQPAAVERSTVFERINEARAARQSTKVTQHQDSMPHRSTREAVDLRTALAKWEILNDSTWPKFRRKRVVTKTLEDGRTVKVCSFVGGRHSYIRPRAPTLADVNAARAARQSTAVVQHQESMPHRSTRGAVDLRGSLQRLEQNKHAPTRIKKLTLREVLEGLSPIIARPPTYLCPRQLAHWRARQHNSQVLLEHLNVARAERFGTTVKHRKPKNRQGRQID